MVVISTVIRNDYFSTEYQVEEDRLEKATFKKYTVRNEKELHLLIEKNLENLEDGLHIIQREYPVESGFLDFLCVDSGGRLVIVEVKVYQDDNMLFQSLKYYINIENNRYKLLHAITDLDIDPNQTPRIILIAQTFSERLKTYASLVIPDIELLRYTAIIGPDKQTGIVFDPEPLATIDHSIPAQPPSIEALIAYNTNQDFHQTIIEARNAFKALGNEVEEYATNSYIGYKYMGRQFAWIKPFRKSVEVGAHIVDESRQLLEYYGIRLETKDEDYQEIVQKAKESFKNLQG